MKVFKGKVVGVGAKTAIVEVERIFAHPLYVRRIRRSKRFHVHDEIGARVGERVSFVECRPVSRTKQWKILKKVGQVEKGSSPPSPRLRGVSKK